MYTYTAKERISRLKTSIEVEKMEMAALRVIVQSRRHVGCDVSALQCLVQIKANKVLHDLDALASLEVP